MPSRPQKVAIVTGATGFVGSHLVRRLLSDGWEVNAIRRSHPECEEMPFRAIRWHYHDRSIDSLMSVMDQVRPDVVFHLASLFLAEHLPQDVERLIMSNILFSSQLLEAMRASGVYKLVNAGTSWQHYNSCDYNPANLYAATKEAFEKIIDYYVDAEGLNAVTLKLYDTYGPADRRSKLFRLLQHAASSGEEIEMSMGEQLIDLVHVDDVTQAFLDASRYLGEMGSKKHERFCVFRRRESLREVVNIFTREWGVRVSEMGRKAVPSQGGDGAMDRLQPSAWMVTLHMPRRGYSKAEIGK